jgi:hypothetical protein
MNVLTLAVAGKYGSNDIFACLRRFGVGRHFLLAELEILASAQA